MGIYKCNHPKCKGHDTFSKSCSEPIIQDYPPLHRFIELLETQSMEALSEQPTEPVLIVRQPIPQPAVAAAGVSSSPSKHFDFWSE